jgi:hypothetical protein
MTAWMRNIRKRAAAGIHHDICVTKSLYTLSYLYTIAKTEHSLSCTVYDALDKPLKQIDPHF